MKKYFNRELSWLSFNFRVLQEAINEEVPLIERLRFLAIYSSNLDEFYRVRVASYMHILKIQKEEEIALSVKKLLKKINRTVKKQQIEFGRIFNEKLIPLLEKEKIYLINQKDVDETKYKFLSNYFEEKIRSNIEVKHLKRKKKTFVKNKGLYLTIEAIHEETKETTHFLVNIPTDKTKRFVVIPSNENKTIIIQLSDVMRLFLDRLLPKYKITHSYAVKLTRDASLYIEDEIAETIEEKISASLYKRKVGDPSRLLYDERMPKEMLKILRNKLGVKKEEVVPGGRYHNFNDFFGFPAPTNTENNRLVYEPLETLSHSILEKSTSYFKTITEQDIMLHFPYQDYGHVVKLIKQASVDKSVEEIKISLYRVSEKSKIAKALIAAAKNGKKVIVFNEIKARFDEELNIAWGKKMKAGGVEVIYSFEELKVHSKICLIKRREKGELVSYAYFGTGNFNEKTSKIYS